MELIGDVVLDSGLPCSVGEREDGPGFVLLRGRGSNEQLGDAIVAMMGGVKAWLGSVEGGEDGMALRTAEGGTGCECR